MLTTKRLDLADAKTFAEMAFLAPIGDEYIHRAYAEPGKKIHIPVGDKKPLVYVEYNPITQTFQFHFV